MFILTKTTRNAAIVMALTVLLVFSVLAPAIQAHPIPFSYLDLHLGSGPIEGTLVAHIADLGHDLGVDPPDALLEKSFAQGKSLEIASLIRSRLKVTADGRELELKFAAVEPVPDRQSLSCQIQFATDAKPAVLRIECALFPYDPQHQTFLNIYDDEKLVHQEIFTRDHQLFVYRSGADQSRLSVLKEFIAAGITHIFKGPDHFLFILGLLLMGGSLMKLLKIVSAFTVAHSVTLSLAALEVENLSPRLIEPLIALSIVYVGIDNLMVGKSGRDMRAWIAFFFGFVHGFGFANVLREFGLPRSALGWSLFSFNFGVEIGQACIVVAAVAIGFAFRNRSAEISGRLVKAGSMGVIVAGTYWFIQRVFL